MALSKLRPPIVADPSSQRMIQEIYGHLNGIISAVNQEDRTSPRHSEGKPGDIRLVKGGDGDFYLQGRFEEGWVGTVKGALKFQSHQGALPSSSDLKDQTGAIIAHNVLENPVIDTSGFGGSGEANTGSGLGGGLAVFDSKSGVDLRFNTLLATDFNLAANVLSIDYTNGQAASGSTKGFLTSTDWTTFNSKVSGPAGSDSYMQYNNGGAFGGDANFRWDDTLKVLRLGTEESVVGAVGFAQANNPGSTYLFAADAGEDGDWLIELPPKNGIVVVTAIAPLSTNNGEMTITGAALTKADDTNVTLALGGSPTAALVATTSLTLGWTGQLAVSRGGTGKASYTTGSIPYYDGSILNENNTALQWNNASSTLRTKNLYCDTDNSFIDRKSLLTLSRVTTSPPVSGVDYTQWMYQTSEGDAGVTFTGHGGIYIKTVEGSPRGVLLGITIDLSPSTENDPYTVNKDVTGLIMSNQGTVVGTEYCYFGEAGAPGVATTAANPLGLSFSNGITIEDKIGAFYRALGSGNIGFDCSALTMVGTDPLAVKTANTQTSQFGTIRGGTASAGTLTLSTTSHATKGKILFGSSAYDEANNRLGLGTASPSSLLTTSEVNTATSGTISHLNLTLSADPASASSAIYRNTVVVQSASGNAQTITGLRGINTTVIHNGTNTVTDIFGGVFIIQKASTGAVTNAYAGYFRVDNNNASGAITQATGVHIAAAVETGTITTNWGLYQAGANDRNYMAGNTTIGSTTATSLLNVGSAAQLQVNSSGLVVAYNGIATVSNGVPSEVATIDTTGLTGNVAVATAYAVPSTGAGQYLITTTIVLTTAGSVSSTLPNAQIVFTDNQTNTAITINSTPVLGAAGLGQTGLLTANTIGTTVSGVIVVNARASTNIQYQTVNYASTAAGMAYAIHIKIIAL